MRISFAFLIFAVLSSIVINGSAVADERPGGLVGYVPDRVVITLRQGVDPGVLHLDKGVSLENAALKSVAEQTGLRNMTRLYPWLDGPLVPGAPDLSRVWAVDFDGGVKGHAPADVAAAWRDLPEVVKAEQVEIFSLSPLPNDPYLISQQYHLRNTTLGGKDVRAVGGWAETTGDTNIIVAIVDSGVDWQHPDLGGTGPDYLDGNIWINWTEWNGTPGLDDDGNGFVDDYRGWDFVTGITDGEAGQDVDVADNDPMDFESHGTAAAGCASAITNNGTGVAGTGWNCRIMAIRVGWLQAGQTGGVVRMDFASQGMVYAAANGASVINCSWGSSSYLAGAVATCAAADCVIVAAAGNSDTESTASCWMGTDARVVAVAATDQNDNRASFSNYGAWIEVCAPGVSITTTYYDHTTGNHTYASVSGTSFASPITAGAVALIRAANPGWTRLQAVSRLRSTADDIDALNPGYENKLGSGRINLLSALGDGFLEVPDEFPEIYDALNSVAAGDTIAVLSSFALDGPLELPAHDFTLIGGYLGGYSSRSPAAAPTVLSTLANNITIDFADGTGPGTVIDGFRLTGGGGLTHIPSPWAGRYGGALILDGVSPTLRNLEISGNSVGSSGQLGCGGGLALLASNAVLENVRINGNTAIYGGGLYIHGGAPTLENCTIEDNVSLGSNPTWEPLGGGVFVQDADLTMNNCTISGHENAREGGGLYAGTHETSPSLHMAGNHFHNNTALAVGGGLRTSSGTIWMHGDRFTDNGPSAGATFLLGGAFFLSGSSATLDSVVCMDNSASGGAGGVIAGAISDVDDCLFVSNTASAYGGGLVLKTSASGQLTRNTFADNESPAGGGGLHLNSSSVTFMANLIAFNTGGGVFLVSGTPEFLCNDVYGNADYQFSGLTDPTGTAGNISLDPEFCGGVRTAAPDWGLQSDSPCVDHGSCDQVGAMGATCAETAVLLSEFTASAGSESVSLQWSLRLDSDPGVFQLQGAWNTRSWVVPFMQVEAGVYAAVDPLTQIPPDSEIEYSLMLEVSPNTWRSLRQISVSLAPTPLALRQAWPNPANPATNIDFSLDEPRRVRIAIFDIAGRCVTTLLDESMGRGTHSLIWRGQDDHGRAAPSGTYFVRMSYGQGAQCRKVALVR